MLRVLIIGAGRIFEKHVNAIQKLSGSLRLVGIVEPDQLKVAQLRAIYQVKLFSDIENAIVETRPDIAVVLTDSGSHYKIGLQLCDKVPHVLIEKPMTLNLKAAEDLVRKYQRSKSTLSVVKQNRYNDAVQYMKRVADSCEFGVSYISAVRLRWCRTQEYYDQAEWRGKWASDGGVIANQAIHHLDLQLWLMGEFESVFAYAGTYGSDIEVEDSVVATIRFKNGGIGTIEATTAARPKNIEASITLMSSHGTVQVAGFAANKLDYCTLNREFGIASKTEEVISDVYGHGHMKLYEDFVKHLQSNKMYPVSGFEALKSIKLINALYKSIEEKREVKASENCYSNFLGYTSCGWQ